MEKYVVSARKYRPDTFETVIGQSSITTTFKNAIKTNHLSHAYLFCGPRGIGKTTCARIFAKTINCFNITENTEACNECLSCKSFNESRSFNVHELDAASNNSVDDIRNLIDQVRIPPQVGKYNIYIIDEVHMLSQAAFNAFLKTLEEPPSHAVFILATTEKHKIIPTILSRCQIFDFNRITIDDIVKHLESIAKKEGITCETEALNIIAQKADGGMRDALSLFDQLASFTGNNITYREVIDNLNVLDYDYFFKLTDAFLAGDITTALLTFDEILKEGFDGHNFINGLAHHFRDLLVCKDEQTLQLLEVGQGIRQKYKEQSAKVDAVFLFESLQVTNTCDLNFKLSKNKRLLVELTLINLCRIQAEKKNSIPEKLETDKNTPPEKIKEPVKVKETIEDRSSVVIEETKPVKEAKTVFKTRNSVSITDAFGKLANHDFTNTVNETEKEILKVVEEPKVSQNKVKQFSDRELLEFWNIYSENLKEEMPRMYSTLKLNVPVLKENYIVELILKNQTQLEDFNSRVKSGLVTFLRTKLENDLIEFDIRVVEEEESNNKRPYTSEDKYKHLLQKNPLLGKLKQEFNLDFD